jgi:excisionase family DNA binding protein
MRDKVVVFGQSNQPLDPLASTALEALLAVVERVVDERVRHLEEAVGQLDRKRGGKVEAEEYLDIELLSKRINTSVKTIRDWVHKRKIPFQKLPTGGIRFPWSKVEAWMKGEVS